jgi:hypothetical protein
MKIRKSGRKQIRELLNEENIEISDSKEWTKTKLNCLGSLKEKQDLLFRRIKKVRSK